MKLLITHVFKLQRWLLSCAMIVFLSGCLSQSYTVPEPQLNYPDTWERLPNSVGQAPTAQCMTQNTRLSTLLNQAVDSNLSIQTLGSKLEEARLGVIIAKADRLPSLSASLSGTRRNSNGLQASSVTNQFSLGVDAQIEIDLWNRLSDVQRQAQLVFRAAQFSYEDSRRVVLGDVANAWYTAIFAQELADVFAQRVTSVSNNLDIIEQAYKQGINPALDVYLARTSFAQEQSRLARQEQTVLESVGALQLLLTQYPSGTIALDSSLPALAAEIPISRPSALLERRPDVQEAWTALLAQDAAVAVAHKQRFPRLVVSASLDDISRQLGDIIDGDDVLWSAFAGLTQPVFQAGRLKALEQQARLRLEQSELAYTAVVQSAFREVEDAFGKTLSLSDQIAASERAFDAATAAYDLSFSQYRRGLVNYATVLQSEQRAFDATSGLLELRYLQLINRVNLCTALGQGMSQ